MQARSSLHALLDVPLVTAPDMLPLVMAAALLLVAPLLLLNVLKGACAAAMPLDVYCGALRAAASSRWRAGHPLPWPSTWVQETSADALEAHHTN